MKLFAWLELILAFVVLPILAVSSICKKSEPISPDEDIGECDQEAE